MKVLIKLVLIGIIVFPALNLFFSCSEEEDCSLSARPMMNCAIYTIDAETNKIAKDTLDSLTVTAFGTDSVIINKDKKVDSLSIPLRYTDNSTVLVFHYSKTSRDTITIYHTNTPYFLSMDCGYQMKQVINKVTYTKHKLDSIHITNSEAGIYEKENIKLFY